MLNPPVKNRCQLSTIVLGYSLSSRIYIGPSTSACPISFYCLLRLHRLHRPLQDHCDTRIPPKFVSTCGVYCWRPTSHYRLKSLENIGKNRGAQEPLSTGLLEVATNTKFIGTTFDNAKPKPLRSWRSLPDDPRPTTGSPFAPSSTWRFVITGWVCALLFFGGAHPQASRLFIVLWVGNFGR